MTDSEQSLVEEWDFFELEEDDDVLSEEEDIVDSAGMGNHQIPAGQALLDTLNRPRSWKNQKELRKSKTPS